MLLTGLIASAFTAGVKFLVGENVPTMTITWGRFFSGFVVLVFLNLKKKTLLPKPNDYGWLALRALTNFVAVGFFYLAIEHSTLVKANLLNMTYPIFIAIFAPFLLKEATGKYHWLAVLISFIGVLLVLDFEFTGLVKGDLYGLICGFIASISLMSLRKARQFDSSELIVFYVMLTGSVGLLPFVSFDFDMSPSTAIVFLLTSLGGVAGQFFLTYSYKYTTALTAAVTTMIRLVFSATWGLIFFSESISCGLIFGSLLIVFAIFLLRVESKKVQA